MRPNIQKRREREDSLSIGKILLIAFILVIPLLIFFAFVDSEHISVLGGFSYIIFCCYFLHRYEERIREWVYD